MANEQAEDDHLSVGVQLPNGQIQKPMSGKHLYWTKPGKIRQLYNNNFATCMSFDYEQTTSSPFVFVVCS